MEERCEWLSREGEEVISAATTQASGEQEEEEGGGEFRKLPQKTCLSCQGRRIARAGEMVGCVEASGSGGGKTLRCLTLVSAATSCGPYSRRF